MNFRCSIIYLLFIRCRFVLKQLQIRLKLHSAPYFAVLFVTNDNANIIHETSFVKSFDNKNSIN